MPGGDERPGGEQQVAALGDDQLADEDDARSLGGGVAAEAGRGEVEIAAEAAGVGLLEPTGERLQLVRGRRSGRERRERLDVHAGRAEPGLLLEAGQVDRLPEALGGVMGADEDGASRLHPLAGVGQEPLGIRDHGVGEGAAVNLGGERADRVDRPGQDHRPHDQVVGERGVDSALAGGDVADRTDVGGDVGLDLLLGQIRERAGVEAGVGVGDVEGQDAADVGQVGGDRTGAGRRTRGVGD